jgi:hypothetical protein
VTKEQLEAMSGPDQIRRMTNTINMCKEDFNQEYSAEELMKIVRACWLSEWDILPDQWTQQQIDAALEHGTPPEFEELPTGIHAKNVTDCYCRKCVRDRSTVVVTQEASL